jgi:hypothetical protein
MGQPGGAGHIANSIQACQISFAKLISDQETVLSIDPQALKTQALNIASDTHGQNNLVKFMLLLAIWSRN